MPPVANAVTSIQQSKVTTMTNASSKGPVPGAGLRSPSRALPSLRKRDPPSLVSAGSEAGSN